MSHIALPDQSVVLVIGDAKRRPGEMADVCDRIGGVSCPWDVDRPDPSLEALHEALKGRDVIRVAMPRAHAKARRQVAGAARKRGFVAIAIELPGCEPVGPGDGYDRVHTLKPGETPTFGREPMPNDLSAITGGIDFVGDVHGCFNELMALLVLLGYVCELTGLPHRHREGRTLVLLGDLTDRGPQNLAVLMMVRLLEQFGARRVLGNHDEKLARWLAGKSVRIAAGLQTTIDELGRLNEDERRDMGAWLGSAESHIVLDGGRVIAAHAGISEELQGRRTSGARSFGLYGDVTGGLDERGHPEARDWALDYAGEAVVVHGHVVHPEPRVVGNVVAVDTGCVFGGSLTAYRWPERDFVSVPAQRTHFESDRFEAA
jgi:protein phosphatase